MTDPGEATRYAWNSNGGCERCDVMGNRRYKADPSRPHPNCSCETVDTYPHYSPCNNDDVMMFLGLDDITIGVADHDLVKTEWSYFIICPTGVTRSGTFENEELQKEYNDAFDASEFWERSSGLPDPLTVWSETLTKRAFWKLQSIAGVQCPPCPNPPNLV